MARWREVVQSRELTTPVFTVRQPRQCVLWFHVTHYVICYNLKGREHYYFFLNIYTYLKIIGENVRVFIVWRAGLYRAYFTHRAQLCRYCQQVQIYKYKFMWKVWCLCVIAITYLCSYNLIVKNTSSHCRIPIILDGSHCGMVSSYYIK